MRISPLVVFLISGLLSAGLANGQDHGAQPRPGAPVAGAKPPAAAAAAGAKPAASGAVSGAGAKPGAAAEAPAAQPPQALLELPAPLAPPKQEPTWLTFERAMERRAAGELGEALELLQRVRPTGYKTPEVEMAMGDIYRAQAEPDLAEWHYRRAYDQKSAFEVAGDRYTLLYRMADMFRQLEQYGKMEEVLLAALSEARNAASAARGGGPYPFDRLHDAVARVFRQNGIDRVLELYRLPELPTAQAHSGLAWYYARSGKPADAVEHALFAAIIDLSQAIDEYRSRLPDYRYESVSRFLSLAGKEADILEFLRSSTVPSDIYSLGVALQGLADGQAATQAWHLLAGSPLSGRWRDLADRQLARPFAEKLPVTGRPAAAVAPGPPRREAPPAR